MSRHSHAAVLARDLQAAQTMLGGLGLAERFDADDLHERIQALRRRRIHLIARPLPADAVHGVWVAAAGADYVFYPEDASPIRRNAIIGHEYGHILFDDAALSGGEHVAAMLLPTLDPSVPAALLARTTYEEAIERRAEIFGTVVAQRVASWAALPGESTPAALEVLARMTSTLEAGAS